MVANHSGNKPLKGNYNTSSEEIPRSDEFLKAFSLRKTNATIWLEHRKLTDMTETRISDQEANR